MTKQPAAPALTILGGTDAPTCADGVCAAGAEASPSVPAASEGSDSA